MVTTRSSETFNFDEFLTKNVKKLDFCDFFGEVREPKNRVVAPQIRQKSILTGAKRSAERAQAAEMG